MHSYGQVNKIEHFFVSSPQAEKYFNFFKDNLGLPVVWKFQTWTDFASGGLSLGNVAFEFVIYKGVTKTKFDGIAFEPKQHMEEFIVELEKHQIAYDTIENNTHVNTNGDLVGWTNLGLPEILPKEANVFVCDYKQRELVSNNRKKAADSLYKKQGGALGILSLEEIVIASKDFEKHKKNFSKLPGVIKYKNNLFGFQSGPSIRLKKSSHSAIEKIIVRVKSIPLAKAYLVSQNLLGKTTKNSIFISETAIDGLQVELID